jgi:hypothetical protein
LESPQRLANRVARDVIFLRQPILNQTLAGFEMPIEDGTTNPVCNHFMQSTGYLADGFQCAFSLVIADGLASGGPAGSRLERSGCSLATVYIMV